VTKVHIEVAKMRQDGFDIVMIGHKGHPEVEGTMGQAGEGMHLVEDIERRAGLAAGRSRADRVRHANHLSVDDAAEIIGALKAKYPRSASRRSRTSATPRKTARTRSSSWRRNATS
jgi:Penicillin tolerance protein